jgi:hypothetical protein
LGQNSLIPGAQDLNNHVGIEEDIHSMPNLFMRVPRRRLRT